MFIIYLTRIITITYGDQFQFSGSSHKRQQHDGEFNYP